MIDQGFIRSNNHHLPVVAYIYTIWKDDFGHSKSNFLHFYVYRCDNLLSKTDADGYVTRYSYTALDLVKKINYNGAKGSVRPDYYKVGHSVDIKNYNLESSSGRRNLVRNIVKQYEQRLMHLPEGSKQSVQIDLRGQNVSDEVLTKLYTEITQKTNGGVSISFKVK